MTSGFDERYPTTAVYKRLLFSTAAFFFGKWGFQNVNGATAIVVKCIYDGKRDLKICLVMFECEFSSELCCGEEYGKAGKDVLV